MRFFVLKDCPISRQYAPTVQAICRDFEGRAKFSLVFVDDDITAGEVAAYKKEFHYVIPAVIDTKQKMSKLAGVQALPTVAVLVGDRLAYVGRIDNRFPKLGTQRTPTRLDLRVALTEILAGKAVSVPRTPVVGCVLPGG